ncbi:N-acetyltryptophan 6-hydroxylase ivoC [Colletotrichum liriopes]|uniref:N-acetyltryptophan 6-hydroxylase ivoC n=1 Tax=Colletotrichum liriopes TaxID=708192 RepID=A0AA37GR61_9PEZI|nr:N-acetyltryptophan 6-hydroxylase ivoC [Colletotrichum liriopes]
MSFNAPHTLFSEADTAKHKERRRLLNPMFSRAGIIKLEPLIREKLALLDGKIERLCRRKEINVYNALRLLTTEIIMQFAFSQSAGMIEEQEDDFGSGFTDALSVASHGVYLMYEKPWVRYIGNVMPPRILRILNPALGNMMNLIEFAATSVRRWQADQGNRKDSYPIVFDRLGSLTESEKMSEGVDLLIAGSDTTASTAATAVMQILSNPYIERKLVNSLDAAIPSAESLPQLLDLEKIEYLTTVQMMLTCVSFKTACVKESLRFTSAAPGRLPRVVPADGEPFVVDGQVIPPGTIVSMSPHTMHTNVGVWGPDARSFNPDRWLTPNAKSLEQYQVAFSKGNRMCIGQNLATAEITIILAHFFRRYKMSLPADFVPPRKVDVFTLEYEKPGIPISVSVRE